MLVVDDVAKVSDELHEGCILFFDLAAFEASELVEAQFKNRVGL